MAKNKLQSGFAHIMIITILLAVALVGMLGFVFWQNFMQPKTTAGSKNNTNQPATKPAIKTEPAVTYKTYTTDKYNISFQYPSTWSLVENSGQDNGYYYRRAEISNETGDKIAGFETGVTGLGGTCGDDTSNFTTLSSDTTKYTSTNYIGAKQPVNLSYTAMASASGGYDIHFGLTDSYTKVGDGKGCANTFYYLFDPGLGDYGMSFGTFGIGTKHFTSLDLAKAYMQSNEYKSIQKMILSLTY